MAIIAFRTDAQLDEQLRRTATEENKTKTEVIRAALDLYLSMRKASSRAKPQRKQDSLADVLKADIGIWDGPEAASVNTSKQLREILGEKRRTRRV